LCSANDSADKKYVTADYHRIEIYAFYEKFIRRLRDPYWKTYKHKMRYKTQIRTLALENFNTKYPNSAAAACVL